MITPTERVRNGHHHEVFKGGCDGKFILEKWAFWLKTSNSSRKEAMKRYLVTIAFMVVMGLMSAIVASVDASKGSGKGMNSFANMGMIMR